MDSTNSGTKTNGTEATQEPASNVTNSSSMGYPIFVTNAQAGAATFAGSESRNFSYYTPKKKNQSVYEDVTVDVQPDPKRHLLQDWIISFADGTAGFSPTWTKLNSSDWHVFRDPHEQWNRSFYIREGNTVRQIQQNIANAKAEGSFTNWDPGWAKIVASHVGALMHAEYGLGMQVFVQAQRDGMTNMINTAITVNSMDKLRSGQEMAIYNMEVAEQIPGFDQSAHKETWMNDPCWQGVRENVERLTATRDWSEQIFAANLVYEPLCEELFRSQFVMQFAAPHGDFVTPTFIGVAEYDYQRNLEWTLELFKMLTSDSQYGAENKRVLQSWLAHWVPYSVKAARLLQPIWSQPRIKVLRFEEAYERAKARFNDILVQLDVQLPKEVSL